MRLTAGIPMLVAALLALAAGSPAASAAPPRLAAAAARPEILPAGGAALAAARAPVLPRIIGGADATPGAFPYVVLVAASYTVGGTPVTFTCSGTLVAPGAVLTAGHCAFDESTGQQLPPAVYQVGLAATSLPFPAGNIRSVADVKPYPFYNPSTGQGDAALLLLTQAPPAGAGTIPLASSTDSALYAAGQPATVVGWGVTSNAAGAAIPSTLQSGSVAVQSNSACAGAGSAFYPGFDLCAAAPGFLPAACHGDSGGPLVASTPAGPVDIGIVSYGIGPACAAAPDFYTRVSSIQPWLAAVFQGLPNPPSFVPPFTAAAAPTAALLADGVAVSFTAPAADPATLPSGYVVSLVNSASVVVASQALPLGTTSAVFPSLQPGAYTAVVTTVYSEGAGAGSASNGVALAPPSNSRLPSIAGTPAIGSTLACQPGAWVWPGASTLATTWLRNGQATGHASPTYPVTAADAGTALTCQVTLTAATGSHATATSAAVAVAARLQLRTAPHVAGVRALGRTLTCRGGTWAHSGALAIAYRWLRNGKAIPGRAGTSMRHRISTGDVGRRLACRVRVAAAGQTASRTTPAITVPRAS